MQAPQRNSTEIQGSSNNTEYCPELSAPQYRLENRIDLIHALPGRLRLRIPVLRNEFEQWQNLLNLLSRIDGLTRARFNSWCLSLVLEYDEEKLDQAGPKRGEGKIDWHQELIATVDSCISYILETDNKFNSEKSDSQYHKRKVNFRKQLLPMLPERSLKSTSSNIRLLPAPVNSNKTLSTLSKLSVVGFSTPGRILKRLYTLSYSFLHKIEKLFTPAIQLGVGSLAFASTCLLGSSSSIARGLVALSVIPIATRASNTLLLEKKASVDALDGLAAIMMLFHGRYIETGFMTALIGLGEFIREATARRCERIVTDLLGLAGQNAWLVKGRKRICIPATEIKAGDTIVIYPGELVPVDGIVTKGNAAIDQAKLTGESHPVEVCAGNEVLASTVNLEGKIYVRCTASGAGTIAGKVVQSLKSAPIHETKAQNYAATLADKMVVPIIGSAAACFLLTGDLVRTMSMLIFDFTTGIRIAAPTSILASMHRAGRRGILIKSGGALERLATIDAIIFDKTGTLTTGEPSVTRVLVFNGYKEARVLQLASAVEQRLHHPASRAIVRYTQQLGLDIPDRGQSQHLNGKGVRAVIDGLEVLIGSKQLMLDENIDTSKAEESEAESSHNGESLAYIAIDKSLEALIAYRDQIRPEAAQTIKSLKKLKIKKLVMATGDNEAAARQVADQIGITDVFARIYPEQKADIVTRLKEEGYRVAVIGDGINDSPALAHADVAISLHGGTEAARHSADLILTDDDLMRLPESIRIARGAMQLLGQNITLAVVPNSAGLFLAGIGYIGPAGSTLLNNGSAICSALNALRPLYSTGWSENRLNEQKVST